MWYDRAAGTHFETLQRITYKQNKGAPRWIGNNAPISQGHAMSQKREVPSATKMMSMHPPMADSRHSLTPHPVMLAMIRPLSLIRFLPSVAAFGVSVRVHRTAHNDSTQLLVDLAVNGIS